MDEKIKLHIEGPGFGGSLSEMLSDLMRDAANFVWLLTIAVQVLLVSAPFIAFGMLVITARLSRVARELRGIRDEIAASAPRASNASQNPGGPPPPPGQ